MRIGSHVSMKAKDYLVGSVNEMLSYQANAMMIYTGAPQNVKRAPIEDLRIEQASRLLAEHGLSFKDCIVHAPYIINLANTHKSETFDLGVQVLKLELQRTAAIGAKVLVLHPGSAAGAEHDKAMAQIIKGLNMVLNDDDSDVMIALETMAGKGSELGRSFEELSDIFAKLDKPERVGVCMDTCHLHDAGYDLRDFDAILEKFETCIPFEKLLCMHINDSKNVCGAHKDRHANIGYGEIGFDVLNNIVHHPRLEQIIKILETPYVEDKAPYAYEIANFRQNYFIDFISQDTNSR